jgi:guanylate kinase
MMTPGPLIIVSGPTGVGKTTVVARLLRDGGLPLRQSVSVTTRPSRPGEIDGVHYHFWTPERFQEAEAAGAFLETATVHGRHRYGTLRSEVERYRAEGAGVVLVIDVQGAAKVRQQCPDAVSIFLNAPWEKLVERVEGRRSEGEAEIRRRLETARDEVRRVGEYDYEVINNDLDETVARLRDLVAGHFTEGKRCSTN